MISFSPEQAFIFENRKLRATFLENLELQNFPFDVQDLSVTIVSEKPMIGVQLIHDEDDPSSVNVGTFADEQEWKLYRHVDVTYRTVHIGQNKDQRQRCHPAIQVTCHVARRPGYFMFNVSLVMVSQILPKDVPFVLVFIYSKVPHLQEHVMECGAFE